MSEVVSDGSIPEQTAADTNARYYAMDAVRGVAMILGVYYHANLFRGMIGGGGPPAMFGSAWSVERFTQEWLHSFRMPMFFLVSGFFSAMLMTKYGVARYLYRRFVRIALPLIVGFFTVGPLYHLAFDYFRSGPSMIGGFNGRPNGPTMNGPPMMGPPMMGPPMGMNFDDLPPPPPGFVPPPLMEFDTDSDGTLSDDEWTAAKQTLKERQSNVQSDENANDRSTPPPFFPAAGGIGGPGMGPPIMGPLSMGMGPPGMRPRGMGPMNMFGEPGAVSRWLFGSYVRNFTLSHLWFLWYLLVFTFLTPWIMLALEWLSTTSVRAKSLMVLERSVRWGLLPIALGIIATPLLALTSSSFGGVLGFASGIGRGFPDFAWHLEKDMPYYASFFLSGWLLFLARAELRIVARWWVPSIIVGIGLFSVVLYNSANAGPPMMGPAAASRPWWIYLASSVAAACTAWGVLGAFQQFCDRPSAIGRYLSDTALWIYLAHQAILAPFLWWLAPLQWPWWASSITATTLTVLTSILLFEALIRPTFLMSIFGPASTRPAASKKPSPAVTSEQHFASDVVATT